MGSGDGPDPQYTAADLETWLKTVSVSHGTTWITIRAWIVSAASGSLDFFATGDGSAPYKRRLDRPDSDRISTLGVHLYRRSEGSWSHISGLIERTASQPRLT